MENRNKPGGNLQEEPPEFWRGRAREATKQDTSRGETRWEDPCDRTIYRKNIRTTGKAEKKKWQYSLKAGGKVLEVEKKPGCKVKTKEEPLWVRVWSTSNDNLIWSDLRRLEGSLLTDEVLKSATAKWIQRLSSRKKMMKWT